MKSSAEINLAEAIDGQRISRFQFLVFFLCLLCLMADGFDAQALGYVVPAMSKQWGVEPGLFKHAFTVGLLGMAIGALALGSLADYVGRRRIILLCALVVGTSTWLMGAVTSIDQLIALRFFAGLAIGGLIPNTLTLAAEFAPTRNRATVVMITACGISTGAALGGLIAGLLIEQHGWPIVFHIGGGLSLALAVVFYFVLPESIHFQALKTPNDPRFIRALGKIFPKRNFATGTRFVTGEVKRSGLTVQHLFTEGRAVQTLLVWFIYFLCLLEIYFLASWLPTLLSKAGVPLQWSVYSTSVLQIAGTVAALTMGSLLERFNPARILMLLFILAGGALLLIGRVVDNHALLMFSAALVGFGVVGGQGGMHAIASRIYPTSMRSTGMGWGLGIGRIGSIVGPLIGGILLTLHWEPKALLELGAIPPLLAACAAFLLSLTFSRRKGRTAPEAEQKQPAAAPELP